LRPGCGALVALLEVATGIRAFSVGKPSPVIMRAARKELGLTTDETTIIGDTMETDVLGGVQLGFHTILVLSGGTSHEDLRHFAYAPECVVESVADLADFLEHGEDCPLWQIPEPWQQPRGPRLSARSGKSAEIAGGPPNGL
jgi:NagD protein